MVTTSTMRSWWSGYCCKPGVRISMFGRDAGEAAAPMVDAFRAQEKALIATGYRDVQTVWIPRNCPSGLAGQICTCSTGRGCSLHNFKVADDIDPFGHGNPHFQRKFGDRWDFDDCKITRVQVETVEAIENTHAEPMFRWLGWLIGDTMHFEGQVPPSRTTVNWDTVPGGIGAQMFTTYGAGRGSLPPDPVVAYWQIVLKYGLGANLGAWGDGSFTGAAKDGVDGAYGDDMKGAVATHAGTDGTQIGPLEKFRLEIKAFRGAGGMTRSEADRLYAKLTHPHEATVELT